MSSSRRYSSRRTPSPTPSKDKERERDRERDYQRSDPGLSARGSFSESSRPRSDSENRSATSPYVSRPSISTALPPPPSSMPPLAPPPPFPQPPRSFSSLHVRNPLTSSERQTAWEQRLTLLSEALRVRSESRTLRSEIDTFQRLSSSYKGKEEERNIFTSRSAQVEAQYKEKNSELNEIMARLLETDFWPVLSPPDVHGLEAKYNEMKTYVGELQNAIVQVNDRLNSIINQRSEDTESSRFPKRPRHPDDAMDVDPSWPSKRQRLSVDSEAKHPQEKRGIAAEDIEEVHNRLGALERQIKDLQNNMVQHDRDLAEELHGHIDVKFEQLNATRARQVPEKAVVSPVDEQFAKDLDLACNSLGDQLGELAGEVGNLILQSAAKDQEIAELKRQNEAVRKRQEETEEKLEKQEQAREKRAREMTTLSDALSAHLTQTPSHDYSPEVVLRAIEQPLLASILSNVQPLLEQLSKNINDSVKNQHSTMYSTLWSKLALTQQLVEAMARKLNPDGGGGNNSVS